MIIKNLFFQNNLKPQINNVREQKVSTAKVSFLGASSLVVTKSAKRLKYEKLHPSEKRSFSGLINRFIFPQGKEILMTLLGHKPTTLLYGYDYEKAAPALKKHKALIESKNVKIVQGRDCRGFDTCYIFHLPKLNETVEKNIDFYRIKFGDKSLTSDRIVEELTSEKRGVLQIEDHALLGVTLGYLAPDSIFHELHCQLFNLTSFIARLKKYPEHEKKMAELAARFSPSEAMHLKNAHKNWSSGEPGYFETRPYANLAPIKKEDLFLDSNPSRGIGSRYYTFMSYVDCDESKNLVTQVKKDIRHAQRTFKTPKDVLNYLLDKNK